jgi:hypothetical protein
VPKFDLVQTQALAKLFATPRETRDDAWRAALYAAVVDASLVSFEPQVVWGPDGFPYFQLALPPAGAFTPFCISHVLEHVLDSGFGVAVFGDPERSGDPEWVFTYGDLLALSLFENFDGDPSGRDALATRADGVWSEKIETGREVAVGAPAEAYLPTRARRVLGAFLRQAAGVPDPKIALVVDPALDPPTNLAFDLSPADFGGDESRFAGVMRALTWFLPRTHALVALPDLGASNFALLP